MIHFKVHLIVSKLLSKITKGKFARLMIFTIKEKNRDNHKRNKFGKNIQILDYILRFEKNQPHSQKSPYQANKRSS